MTEKVTIGVIGLGIMGEQYVRIYNAHPLAEVVAICNRSPERLNTIGDKYGIATRYSDVGELLGDERVDAVCIATPDFAAFRARESRPGCRKACSLRKTVHYGAGRSGRTASTEQKPPGPETAGRIQSPLAFLLQSWICEHS